MGATKTRKIAKNKRILFVVTEDWYFISHRLAFAKYLKTIGYDVAVATCVNSGGNVIIASGIQLFSLSKLKRGSLNPFTAMLAVIELAGIYSRFKPDILHHVALMPVVLGYFAACLSGVRRRVNAIAGLGFVFSSRTFKARLIRLALMPILMISLSGSRAIALVQNEDNLVTLKQLPIKPRAFRLICGVGVNTSQFTPPSIEPVKQRVVLVARMVWGKGISDFVELANRFRDGGEQCEFVLVGGLDQNNPASVPIDQLLKWNQSRCPAWVDHKIDMPQVLRCATLVCLPSTYGEGVPKALIEAASCGRPIVAYDIAGCREVVHDGVNGFLVPPGDIDALEAVTRKLLGDTSDRLAMGRASRRLAVKEFSEAGIFKSIEAIYLEMLDR